MLLTLALGKDPNNLDAGPLGEGLLSTVPLTTVQIGDKDGKIQRPHSGLLTLLSREACGRTFTKLDLWLVLYTQEALSQMKLVYG